MIFLLYKHYDSQTNCIYKHRENGLYGWFVRYILMRGGADRTPAVIAGRARRAVYTPDVRKLLESRCQTLTTCPGASLGRVMRNFTAPLKLLPNTELHLALYSTTIHPSAASVIFVVLESISVTIVGGSELLEPMQTMSVLVRFWLLVQ